MSKVILVTGATGKQGGAVINALLDQKADVEILAVTRNADSAKAHKLVDKYPRIKLVQGDMGDTEELFEEATHVASGPIWGVFSVQVPKGNGQSVRTEEAQGKALVDQALRHGVKHFVYTSVDRGGDKSFENPTDIPHFISKHHIEHHIVEKTKGTNLSWTILRPVTFFDNIAHPFIGKAFATSWKIALKEKPLQCVATTDIGYFAAQAFLSPDQFKNRALSLAGDELTFEQLARVFEEKTGKPLPLTYEFVCSTFMYTFQEVGRMFKWFYAIGYGANIPELRKIHPGLKDFGAWLEKDSPFFDE